LIDSMPMRQQEMRDKRFKHWTGITAPLASLSTRCPFSDSYYQRTAE
jgi:hypothetical protein